MKRFIYAVVILWLTTAFTYGVQSGEAKDISNQDWFYSDVMDLIDLGIIRGYPDGTFRPNNTIQRDEFITIIIKSLGYDVSNHQEYWAYHYLEKAEELEMIDLGEDEIANLKKYYTQAISRVEMAVIVSKTLEEQLDEDYKKYRLLINDYPDIDPSEQDAVAKVYSLGIITGYPDGKFQPNLPAKRSEASTILMRLLKEERRKEVEVPEFNPIYLTGSWKLQMKDSQRYYLKEDSEGVWMIFDSDGSCVIIENENEYKAKYEVYYNKMKVIYEVSQMVFDIQALDSRQMILARDEIYVFKKKDFIGRVLYTWHVD